MKNGIFKNNLNSDRHKNYSPMFIYHAMIRHICKHVLQAEGQTVLHIASLNGDENMTRTLYLARANPSVTDNEGNNETILLGRGSFLFLLLVSHLRLSQRRGTQF